MTYPREERKKRWVRTRAHTYTHTHHITDTDCTTTEALFHREQREEFSFLFKRDGATSIRSLPRKDQHPWIKIQLICRHGSINPPKESQAQACEETRGQGHHRPLHLSSNQAAVRCVIALKRALPDRTAWFRKNHCLSPPSLSQQQAGPSKVASPASPHPSKEIARRGISTCS